jgi:hypothetical protein
VRTAMVVTMAKMMMMSVGTAVFHCCCYCSGREGGGKRQPGGEEVSLSGIGSGCRREAQRHLFPGPVDAKGGRDD